MPAVSCNAQGPGDLGSVEKAHAFLSQARCVAPVAQPALGSKSWLPLHEQWNERVVKAEPQAPISIPCLIPCSRETQDRRPGFQ